MSQDKKVINRILFSRAQIVAFGFALVIFTGTVLLMLPISSKTGEVTNFLDSLFTSTSATCVTGLVVVDTFTHWSLFGQIVILCLIQIGGLGVVTITAMLYMFTRKRMSINMRALIQEYFLKRHEWCRKNAQKDCCKSIYYRRSRSDSSMYKIYTGDGYS